MVITNRRSDILAVYWLVWCLTNHIVGEDLSSHKLFGVFSCPVLVFTGFGFSALRK